MYCFHKIDFVAIYIYKFSWELISWGLFRLSLIFVWVYNFFKVLLHKLVMATIYWLLQSLMTWSFCTDIICFSKRTDIICWNNNLDAYLIRNTSILVWTEITHDVLSQKWSILWDYKQKFKVLGILFCVTSNLVDIITYI